MSGNELSELKWQKKVDSIRRPPFDFEIDEVFTAHINDLVDTLQSKGSEAKIAVLEDSIFGMTRELRAGSEEEAWVIDYYCNGGWAR
jgi:hypothetical protein